MGAGGDEQLDMLGLLLWGGRSADVSSCFRETSSASPTWPAVLPRLSMEGLAGMLSSPDTVGDSNGCWTRPGWTGHAKGSCRGGEADSAGAAGCSRPFRGAAATLLQGPAWKGGLLLVSACTSSCQSVQQTLYSVAAHTYTMHAEQLDKA